MSQMKLDQLRFQEIMRYLVQVDQTKSFEKICSDLNITKGQLFSFIEFLKESSYDLEDREAHSQFQFDFNLLDWVQYQVDNPYHSFEKTPLTSLVEKNLHMAIGQGHSVEIKIFGKAYHIYPHQLVYLDGELNLICEGVAEKCLLCFPFAEIKNVNVCEEGVHPRFGYYDVSAFIQKMRAVDEKEERLVLKILDPKRFKTENFHEFFANPCLILTPRGESIWAASVEKSENLFDWLYQMFDFIEILDPTSLKKDFFDYCQKKYKQHA